MISGALSFYGSYDFLNNGSKKPCIVTAGHVGKSFYNSNKSIIAGGHEILNSVHNNTEFVYPYGLGVQ